MELTLLNSLVLDAAYSTYVVFGSEIPCNFVISDKSIKSADTNSHLSELWASPAIFWEAM